MDIPGPHDRSIPFNGVTASEAPHSSSLAILEEPTHKHKVLPATAILPPILKSAPSPNSITTSPTTEAAGVAGISHHHEQLDHVRIKPDHLVPLKCACNVLAARKSDIVDQEHHVSLEAYIASLKRELASRLSWTPGRSLSERYRCCDALKIEEIFIPDRMKC